MHIINSPITIKQTTISTEYSYINSLSLLNLLKVTMKFYAYDSYRLNIFIYTKFSYSTYFKSTVPFKALSFLKYSLLLCVYSSAKSSAYLFDIDVECCTTIDV